MLIRPFSPCHPAQAMAGRIFSHIWNPYPALLTGLLDFHVCLHPGLGLPYGRLTDCRYLDPLRLQAPHQYFGAQGGNSGPPSLGFSITGQLIGVGPIPTPYVWSWICLHPEIVNQIFRMWRTPAVHVHVCHNPQHASSPVYVSSSGAPSICEKNLCHKTGRGGRCTFPPFPCLAKSFRSSGPPRREK